MTKSVGASSPKSSSRPPSGITEGRYLPVISVIVPVHNVAKLIERCVESIRSQVYPNLEIILVDDGSTDMSGTFCDVFAKKDHRIKVIHQSNQGLSAARNAGLKLATGKWVTFVDSDDWLAPDMIDVLHRLCYDNKLKMSICGFREISETDLKDGLPAKPSAKSAHAEILSTMDCLEAMLCERGFSMSAWGKLYARELFDLVKYPEHRLYEDVGTTYQLVTQCDQIAVTDYPGYNYYQHPESITKQSFSLHKMDLIDLTDEMCDNLLIWGKELPATDRCKLEDLIRKRRMHARFSILRQIVMLEEGNHNIDAKSLKNAEQSVVKYLRKHKQDILRNPLASRRDKLAMRSLQLGLPAFKFAWQKYSAKR